MEKFFLILFFLIFIFRVNVHGQSHIEHYIEKGDSLYDLGMFDESVKEFEFAWSASLKEKRWNKAAESLNGICYGFLAMKKHLELSLLLVDKIHFIEKNCNLEPIELAKSWLFLGVCERKKEQYNEAIIAYKNAIKIYEKKNANSKDFSRTLNYLGQIYLRRLNYPSAIDCFEKAIQSDSTHNLDGELFGYLCYSHEQIEDYDTALKYVQKGLKIPGLSNIQYSHLLETGASVLASKKEFQKAKTMAKNSINLVKTDEGEEDRKMRIYILLSEIAKNENNVSLAFDYIQKAIIESKIAYGSKDREKAKMYVSIGETYDKANLLDSALSHYQQALIQVFPKFNSTNIADNPDIKDVYTESWIMTAAARKAEALMVRYHQKGNIADLHNAAYCFDLSLASVKMLHKSYGSENAKLYMGDYSHEYFEEAIEVNYLLYTLTGDQSKLQKIFSLMEESKASVLSEAIQKNKALLLEGIPDSLLELEQDLRITIADLITQQKNTNVEGQDAEAEAKKLESQLSDTQLKYERLLEKMKEDYPQFRNYVEELPLPSFRDVTSRLLDDKSIFVEYFWGEKALYCLSIGRNGANIFKVERNSKFNDLIQQYLTFFKDANAILNDPDCYLSTAHELYQALFAKVLNAANAHPTNILLVPDGLLGYLPFDALVTTDKGTTASFGKVDFLLKKHGLHYGYSAHVLLQQLENHRKKGQLLRVMPRFAAGERGLSPLEYSDEETAGVRAWQSLDGPLATKASFLQMASQCRLIHLSTHAESNSGQGEPHIELADGQLMLPELYAMNLSAADLVVLSACETGLGKLEKGEGVMSLARGFAYAGANSLVASLWKVNERSTATLFAHFYQYLSEGKTKSEALRLAKLSTLENAESETRQSPYYWAGFVFMGNDGEMDLPTGLPIGRIAVPLVVASLAGGIFYLRKRRRRLIA